MNPPNKSPSRLSRSSLASLLSEKTQKLPSLVPPVLQQVGKLAAGVASVSTEFLSSGSATGNPRNKCALSPGHSLMDWIRLGASGKDLTGVGDKAGRLTITKAELAKHNKINDIWLAIRGRVYNVTAYIPFHPGGPDELMKAAGIDATKLFEQVHPWVNYDQILQKCLVGRLVAMDPATDTTALFYGEQSSDEKKPENVIRVKELKENLPSKQNSPTEKEISNRDSPKVQPTKEAEEASTPTSKAAARSSSSSVTSVSERDQPPKFDWIQRLGSVTIYFYTRALANPLVEVFPPTDNDRSVRIVFQYDGKRFQNDITFVGEVGWPCTTKVAYEVGKIEMKFEKKVERIWEYYGELRQDISDSELSGAKYAYIFRDTPTPHNHNVYLMVLDSTDGRKIVTPLGKHVRVFANIHGLEASRSYTPIPITTFTDCLSTNIPSTDTICFAIKLYQGNVSEHIISSNKNDMLYITKPFGDFELSRLERRDGFVMLAAGTGITPMLGLIVFLLERRVKKCQYIRLVCFNRKEKDRLFEAQLNNLQGYDPRLHVTHVLSEPENEWPGLRGHVNKDMIWSLVDEHIKDTGYTIQDVFFFVCGPDQFNALALAEMAQLGIAQEQMHLFQG